MDQQRRHQPAVAIRARLTVAGRGRGISGRWNSGRGRASRQRPGVAGVASLLLGVIYGLLDRGQVAGPVATYLLRITVTMSDIAAVKSAAIATTKRTMSGLDR